MLHSGRVAFGVMRAVVFGGWWPKSSPRGPGWQGKGVVFGKHRRTVTEGLRLLRYPATIMDCAPSSMLLQQTIAKSPFQVVSPGQLSAGPPALLLKGLRCFCCFCRKLSANEHSFAVEILDSRWAGLPDNSETTPASWWPFVGERETSCLNSMK